MKTATAFLLFMLAFLCGCASTIEDRKKERLSTYTQLPPETQTLVDTGQIKVGMPKDAVYIAWGKPEQVIQSESEQGRSETWVYYGSTLRPYHYYNYGHYGWGGPFYHRYYYSLPYLETDWYPQYFVSGEVTFQDDRVAHWRHLPRPPY